MEAVTRPAGERASVIRCQKVSVDALV